MSVYAIGDVQGCYQSLLNLLSHIQFNSDRDILWFTGDLVNRGPQSLEVLRFIKSLGEAHKTVLGNHDLHLLACGLSDTPLKKDDTLSAILAAPDCAELLDWLKYRPLMHYDAERHFVLVHAGLAPMWQVEQALLLAREVEGVLQGKHPQQFLQHMYGNEPLIWHDDLAGIARLRTIVNYLTRMRFCTKDGGLELAIKGPIANKPSTLFPWFAVPHRLNREAKIIFGHWAALAGKVDQPNLFALDTGCVWGNSLSAMRLEDQKRFSVPCAE